MVRHIAFRHIAPLTRVSSRLLALALLSVGLSVCGAGWRNKLKSADHSLPKKITIYVAMSPAVANSDSGLAAAVVDALATDLIKRGYDAPIEVAKAGEKPPVPRIELQMVESTAGSTEMRGAGQLAGVPGMEVAGASSIVVDCYVVAANGKVTFQGRASGLTMGNTTGYDAVEAGERVGLSIASEVSE
jgi:hypothetical protein